jgi:hypothetical protein
MRGLGRFRWRGFGYAFDVDVLVPVQRGEMVRETGVGTTPSYWHVIPQFGRVWREKRDGEWALGRARPTRSRRCQALLTGLRVTSAARYVAEGYYDTALLNSKYGT